MRKIDENITCPYCTFTSEDCNFPDLFYLDVNNTEGVNNQYKLLQELQDIGYNIVTCGECGQVFIIKTREEDESVIDDLQRVFYFLTVMCKSKSALQAEVTCINNYNFTPKEFEHTLEDMTAENLINLYEKAIELIKGLNTGYTFTGSDLKNVITYYVDDNFLLDEKNEFYENISSLENEVK